MRSSRPLVALVVLGAVLSLSACSASSFTSELEADAVRETFSELNEGGALKDALGAGELRLIHEGNYFSNAVGGSVSVELRSLPEEIEAAAAAEDPVLARACLALARQLGSASVRAYVPMYHYGPPAVALPSAAPGVSPSATSSVPDPLRPVQALTWAPAGPVACLEHLGAPGSRVALGVPGHDSDEFRADPPPVVPAGVVFEPVAMSGVVLSVAGVYGERVSAELVLGVSEGEGFENSWAHPQLRP